MKRIALILLTISALSAVSGQSTIDKPIATVKLGRQEVISTRQFKADLDKIESTTGKKLPLEKRKELLDSKVNAMLFFQYCEREKIVVADAEVNAAIAKVKAGLGAGATDAKVETLFRSQGIFMEPRSYIKQQLLFQNYLQTKKSDALKALQPPSSSDILKAYELLKSSLVRPDTVRISVLFIDLRPLSPEEKKKSAEAVRQMGSVLKSSPSRFDEFIIKASDPDASYKATASLYVEKTPQFQELYGNLFMERIFSLKAGEISDVIENEAGLQIVRVNEILPQKLLALSDPIPGQQSMTVQDLIRQNLAEERQVKLLAQIQDDLITQLRKEGSVKIFEENLNF